jgi:triacylglycerol lipase
LIRSDKLTGAMLPVVLHHGFLGTDELRLGPLRLGYYRGIDRAIARRGYPVIVTRVHPSSSIEVRARQLKESLLRQLEPINRLRGQRQKVILVGHSMGGLDARYAVAKLGLADVVAAVVTISTPHRGSPMADWVVRHLGQRLGGIGLANLLRVDLRAVLDLTTRRCARFNTAVADVEGVAYFSISTSAPWKRIPAFALSSWAIVRAAEGDNDGLVSPASATWGTHLCTWPMNHWQAINHGPLLKWRNEVGQVSEYWLAMLDRVERALAGQAEGAAEAGESAEAADAGALPMKKSSATPVGSLAAVAPTESSAVVHA